MMTKANIVDAVAAKNNLSKKDSEAVVNTVLEAITGALKEGDKVQLIGFGTFDVKTRAARTGRNPRTGETLEIAASKNVGFSAGKKLKDAIN